jgi:hypothetical protein
LGTEDFEMSEEMIKIYEIEKYNSRLKERMSQKVTDENHSLIELYGWRKSVS